MSDQFNTGGYAPMPSEPGGPATPAGPPPPTVQNAVRLMFLRAALGVISLIVLFATKNSLKDAIRKANPGYDTSKLDTAVNAGIVVAVVIGIIFIVLYVLLALQVRKGKNWARIVTWVLAGLGVLSGLSSLAQTGTGLNKILGIIGLLIDIAIIVFLALGPSNPYFRRRV